MKSIINVEPIGFQLVGETGWLLRWLWQPNEDDEILMFTRMDCIEICGSLSGSNPSVKLVFDRNGIIHCYFKVFDPFSNTCVGIARCHKGTARKIVEKFANQRSHRPAFIEDNKTACARKRPNNTEKKRSWLDFLLYGVRGK